MKEIEESIEYSISAILEKSRPNAISHLRMFMLEQNQDSYYRGVRHGALVVFIAGLIFLILNMIP